MKPVLTIGLVVALSVIGCAVHAQYLGVTCGYSTEDLNGGSYNLDNIPLFNPVTGSQNLTWDDWVEELAAAGVDYVAPDLRGSGPVTPFGNPSDLVPLLQALQNRGLSDRIKVAIFDDNAASWCAQWNYANGRGFGYAQPFDISNTNNWFYLWENNYRAFYQTVPDANRFKIDGRPVIIIWTGNAYFVGNMQGNASRALKHVRQQCQSTFGFNPFIIVSGDFLSNDTTCNDPSVVDAIENWFTPNSTHSNGFTLATFNGIRIGALCAQFQNPTSDPSGWLNPAHGTSLANDLMHTRGNGALLTLVEGFTDWEEDAALFRVRNVDAGGNVLNYNQTYYDYPNQRLNIMRQYGNNAFPVQLKMEAEACDYFGGSSPRPGFTNYYRNGSISIEPTGDTGGGYDISNVNPGQWMEWEQVPIQGAKVHLQVRVASPNNNSQLHFIVDGITYPTMTVPNTGGWQTWTTIDSGTTYQFSKNSTHTARLVCDTGGFNINYWQFHDDIPIGSTIALQSQANSLWVSAGTNGASPLLASAQTPGTNESFRVVDASGVYGYGNVALFSLANNLYVSLNNTNQLIANSATVGSGQIFRWTDNGDGSLALRSVTNSLAVTAENAGSLPLIANRINIGLWETFNYIAVTNTSSSLRAWLPFDSTLTDATGNGHTGAFVGNTTYSSSVPNTTAGTASLQLPDGNSSVVVTSPGDLSMNTGQPFTLACWFSGVTNSASWPTMIMKQPSSGWSCATNNRAGLMIAPSGHLHYDVSCIGYAESSATVTNGLWHHGVVVYSGTNYQLYVDGTADGTGTFAGCNEGAHGEPSWTFSVGYGFVGNIDEVSFWKLALTPAQVQQIYASGVGASLGPPVASFSADPTNGMAPLVVTFTDSSTGTITNWFWNFGDGITLNTTSTSVLHTYATAGSNTVTEIVSGPGGSSTDTVANLIIVSAVPGLTPFQAWQLLYFGCTNCPQATATADPDGDGLNNYSEYLADTSPTDPQSGLRITSVSRSNRTTTITWTGGLLATQYVETCETLVGTNSWVRIFTNTPPTLATNTLAIVDPGGSGQQRFFRIAASAASTPGPMVNVKDFGALGNGVANDNAAFRAAAQAISQAGSGTLIIPPGTYIVGQQAHTAGQFPYYQAQPIFQLQNVNSLVIEGNGATIRFAPGLRFGSFDKNTGQVFYPPPGLFIDYDYRVDVGSMFDIRQSHHVVIRNLELDGNSSAFILGGPWGDTGWQVTADGILLYNNSDVTVATVHTHHHGRDGIIVGYTGLTATDPPTPHTLINVVSEYNARQALSWVGGRGLTATGCQFNHTQRGRFGSAPGAGVDIEAEDSVCRDGLFVNCEFVNNGGCGMVSDSGDGGYSCFSNCMFWGVSTWSVWPNKPGLVFQDCTIYGSAVHGFGSAQTNLATQYHGCYFEDKAYGTNGVYYLDALINCGGGDNITFSNCTVIANATRAFWLDDTNTREIVSGCRIVHRFVAPNYDFQSLFRGTYLENTRFEEDYPPSTTQQYYIAVQKVGVGPAVSVTGPHVKWGNWSSGATGLIPQGTYP